MASGMLIPLLAEPAASTSRLVLGMPQCLMPGYVESALSGIMDVMAEAADCGKVCMLHASNAPANTCKEGQISNKGGGQGRPPLQ